jgi:predicted Zn-dependent protease
VCSTAPTPSAFQSFFRLSLPSESPPDEFVVENLSQIFYIRNINMRLRPRLATLAASFIALSFAGQIAAAPPPQSQRSASDRDITAIGKRTLGRQTDRVSADKEKAIGQSLAAEVEKTAVLIDDPQLTAYIYRLAQSIAQNSDAKFPITVKLIKSDVPGEFVLPGGYLYVYSGLIIQTENESELAGMLAHAIAHVALRSQTGMMTEQALLSLVMIPAQVYFPQIDPFDAPHLISTTYGLAEIYPVSLLKFRRDDEFDADYFGLQYLYKSGYDPDSYLKFLDRTWNALPPAQKKVPAAYSDHPPVSQRIKAMEKEIAEIFPPRDSDIISSADFEAFKERARVLQSILPQPGDLRLKYDSDFETPPFLRRLKQDLH